MPNPIQPTREQLVLEDFFYRLLQRYMLLSVPITGTVLLAEQSLLVSRVRPLTPEGECACGVICVPDNYIVVDLTFSTSTGDNWRETSAVWASAVLGRRGGDGWIRQSSPRPAGLAMWFSQDAPNPASNDLFAMTSLGGSRSPFGEK